MRAALVDAGLSEGGAVGPVCVLRKDFLIDEYQLLEARAHGADTALLIVAILPPDELVRLMAASRDLGMEPLVEVNTEEEMRIALEAGARVIGVNNRNLHTFEVDMGTTGRLAAMLPANRSIHLLALSGVSTRADALDLSRGGVRRARGRVADACSFPRCPAARAHGPAAAHSPLQGLWLARSRFCDRRRRGWGRAARRSSRRRGGR